MKKIINPLTVIMAVSLIIIGLAMSSFTSQYSREGSTCSRTEGVHRCLVHLCRMEPLVVCQHFRHHGKMGCQIWH